MFMQMLNFFKSGVGSFILGIAALLGCWYSYQAIAPGELSYFVKTIVPLVNTQKPNQFRFFFKGKQLDDPCIVQVRYENTGSKPINRGDIDIPLEINIPRDLFVDVEIVPKKSLSFTSNGKTVRISDIALNPGESLGLTLFCSSLIKPDELIFSGHIQGATLSTFDSRNGWLKIISLVLSLALVLILCNGCLPKTAREWLAKGTNFQIAVIILYLASQIANLLAQEHTVATLQKLQ